MFLVPSLLLLVISFSGVTSQLFDCGISGCYPGQILSTVSEKRIYDALGSVVGTGRQRKKCALGIGNVAGSNLAKPRWYTHSGMIHAAAAYELPTKKSLLLLFTKTNFGLSGTEGVLTYDFEDNDYKLAIMWSVPAKEEKMNVYNVKVYPKSITLNKDLYEHMKSVSGAWEAPKINSTGPEMQERVEYGIKLRVHMTGDKQAIETVTVDSRGFDATLGSARKVTCQKKGFSGMRCRMECPGLGQCWTDRQCSETAANVCNTSDLPHCSC